MNIFLPSKKTIIIHQNLTLLLIIFQSFHSFNSLTLFKRDLIRFDLVLFICEKMTQFKNYV